MSTFAASDVKYGGGKGSTKSTLSKENSGPNHSLGRAVLLPKAEWLRIKESLTVQSKYKESCIQAAKKQEALKKRAEELAAEKAKQLAAAKMQKSRKNEEERKEAIEKATTQCFYRTARVRGFQNALRITEVLKERDAQIQYKQRAQKAAETQRQEMEEQNRKILALGKEKMMKLKEEKETEMIRRKNRTDALIDRLAAQQKAVATKEKELLAKAIAQREAKEEQEAREQAEKKQKRTAAILKSIADHREATNAQKMLMEQTEKKRDLELLHANREADRVFLERQQLQAQRDRVARKALLDGYIDLMAEKRADAQRLREAEKGYKLRNSKLLAEEEGHFQQYAKHVIEWATQTGRNTHTLRKAAWDSTGGGYASTRMKDKEKGGHWLSNAF